MKSSEKLVAYKKAQADYKDACKVIEEMTEEISKLGSIDISSNLNIDRTSSEKQFLYALGILSNQIAGCSLLNLPDADYTEKRNQITALWEVKQERELWMDYRSELINYYREVEELLDSNDKFQLLEYPVKK